MKATLQKNELLWHRKRLLAVKPRWKKVVNTACVTISVSEKFSITGPAFRHDLACQTMRWGTVSLPYRIWKRLVEDLVPELREEEITITAESFEIHFGTTKLNHPDIEVRKLDRLALEIPTDATPMQIVQFALGQDFRRMRKPILV